jgi:HEPN domain-containing protein
MPIDRVDFRNLAELRVQDAKVLIDNGQYDAGYYVAGYAVECALKAVIAGQTRQYQFPDLGLARRVHTHNIRDLLEASGIREKVEQEFARDPELLLNWETVLQWSEGSRYEFGRHKGEAEKLYRAITDPTHGILACIAKQH